VSRFDDISSAQPIRVSRKRKGYRREAGPRRSLKQACESMDKPDIRRERRTSGLLTASQPSCHGSILAGALVARYIQCGLPPGQAKQYGCRTYSYQGRPYYYYEEADGRIVIRRPTNRITGKRGHRPLGEDLENLDIDHSQTYGCRRTARWRGRRYRSNPLLRYRWACHRGVRSWTRLGFQQRSR
jgi:hypothetical protein